MPSNGKITLQMDWNKQLFEVLKQKPKHTYNRDSVKIWYNFYNRDRTHVQQQRL